MDDITDDLSIQLDAVSLTEANDSIDYARLARMVTLILKNTRAHPTKEDVDRLVKLWCSRYDRIHLEISLDFLTDMYQDFQSEFESNKRNFRKGVIFTPCD